MAISWLWPCHFKSRGIIYLTRDTFGSTLPVVQELLSWGNVIGALLGLTALAFGALTMPKRPWYRPAQGFFVAAALVAEAKIIMWGIITLRSWPFRVGICFF